MSIRRSRAAELVEKKVKLLSLMAGAFQTIDGNRHYLEYNVVKDITSAQVLAERWPTAMVYSGFEIGIALPYPAISIERDYGYVPHHPLAEAYIRYIPPPHNRPTWDLTSVLYAVLGDRGYFDFSPPGKVTVEADGFTRFAESPQGSHRYLILRPEQKPRVLEALVQLSSQPPRRSRAPSDESDSASIARVRLWRSSLDRFSRRPSRLTGCQATHLTPGGPLARCVARQAPDRTGHEVARQRVLRHDGRRSPAARARARRRFRADRQRHQGRARPEPSGRAGRRDDRSRGERDRDRAGRFQGARLGVQAGRDAGIIVVNIDNKLDDRVMADQGIKVPFVGPDNRAGARKVGEYLAKRLKPGDEVVVLEGIRTAFNGQQRKLGFEDAMKSAGVKIVDSQTAQWEMDQANRIASAMLGEHPRIKAMLCCNDSMALGALAAVKSAGRAGEVLIVGFDNIAAIQSAIKDGSVLATADQHADQLAVHGIELALKLLKHESPPADTSTPVDLITAETLEKP